MDPHPSLPKPGSGPGPGSGSGSGSDLRRAALQGRMGSRPPLASLNEGAEVLESSPALEQDKHQRQQPGGTGSTSGPGGGTMGPPPSRRTITPVGWEQYWDRQEAVVLEGRGTFNVYLSGTSGPVVLCVHGGGYTGLTWSLLLDKLKDKYRVVAPDLRGHGLTSTNDDLDFSKETMSQDIVLLWQAMFGPGGTETAPPAVPPPSLDGTEAAPPSAPSPAPTPTLLVGHSMGGALATWAAASKSIPSLQGLVVIDVVEGTALAALPYMEGVLSSRPGHFPSLEEGIAWCARSGMCKSKAAAAVSFPSQLREETEQEQEEGGGQTGRWVWRTPLTKSQPFWTDWYTGLSEQFLQVSCPKMLLLAGTDRLDKVLTIGQMQGKFQLALMPTAGHAIQEDEAARTAEYIQQFLLRFRIGLPPMQVPKAPIGTKPVLPMAAGPIPPS